MSSTHLRSKHIFPKLLLFVVVSTLLVTIAQPSHAQTLTTLYSFAGYPNDGAYPNASVIFDAQGNLYGTAEGLGVGSCHRATFTCGTIFKLTPNGGETILYSFASGAHAYPMSGVIFDAKGSLYATTHGTGGPQSLDGSVFKLSKQRHAKALHVFRYNRIQSTDGAFPVAGLIMDSQGNLYGTTAGGGDGYGIVFEVNSASGAETVLHRFSPGAGSPEGANPRAALVMDAQGNLYGTTTSGGVHGYGTVFKLTPSGSETILYNFCAQPNCADGLQPYSTLIMDEQGNLYGTTSGGGTPGNGAVFKLTPSGTETVLYNFCSQTDCADGAYPASGLVRDAQGNLYGTTYLGGFDVGYCAQEGCGTIFKVTPSGAETVLYNFCSQANCLDGAYPVASLIFDAQGNLYGTTQRGGTSNRGTVFRLTP